MVPSATPPTVADADVLRAVAFREEFGLRADRAYVESVSQDPKAQLDFGVPLLPAEVSELEARSVAASIVVPMLEA